MGPRKTLNLLLVVLVCGTLANENKNASGTGTVGGTGTAGGDRNAGGTKQASGKPTGMFFSSLAPVQQ